MDGLDSRVVFFVIVLSRVGFVGLYFATVLSRVVFLKPFFLGWYFCNRSS